VFDTETQSRPDSRMNRTPEHPDRLSPSRPFLLASLVTRPPKIVSEATSYHIYGTVLTLPIETSACNQGLLSLYHWEGRRLLPHEFCDISSSSHLHRDEKATPSKFPGYSHSHQAGLFYLAELSGARFHLRDGASRRARTPVQDPSIAACALTPT
jgi:hypothetical protein